MKVKQHRALRLRGLPVILLVAVELGQRQFLQLDLQVLVLPLQVHDHAVQEVDLMADEEDESENRQATTHRRSSVTTSPGPRRTPSPPSAAPELRLLQRETNIEEKLTSRPVIFSHCPPLT